MTHRQIAANLHAATADPARRIEYRAGGTVFNALPLFLILIALGLAMLIFGTDRVEGQIAAWGLVVGLPMLLALGLLVRRAAAPAALILAPEGLALRFHGVLTVPWSAIRAIETRSFEGFMLRLRGRQRIGFKDVTMIRLPPGYLEQAEAAGQIDPGGPTLDWVLRRAEGGDWIALHHEDYGLTPAEVRTPVEARWTAFRNGPPPAASPQPPLRLGGFRPARPALFALGTIAGGAAILVLMANLAGLWETPAQAAARALDERLEADRAAYRAEEAARQERQRDFERRMDDFERRMRETFPTRP